MNNRWRKKKKLEKYMFSKKEIYEADHTMAVFLLALLKQYKKAKRVGFPGFDEADTPEKWEALLDRFIWTFDQIVSDYPDSPVSLAWKKRRNENTNERSAVDFLGCITQEVKADEIQYRKHVQEGLSLFAKFFQTFWD